MDEIFENYSESLQDILSDINNKIQYGFSAEGAISKVVDDIDIWTIKRLFEELNYEPDYYYSLKRAIKYHHYRHCHSNSDPTKPLFNIIFEDLNDWEKVYSIVEEEIEKYQGGVFHFSLSYLFYSHEYEMAIYSGENFIFAGQDNILMYQWDDLEGDDCMCVKQLIFDHLYQRISGYQALMKEVIKSQLGD